MHNYGGNQVKKLITGCSDYIFADKDYFYAMCTLFAGTPLILPNLNSVTIFGVRGPEGFMFEVEGKKAERGDVIQIERGEQEYQAVPTTCELCAAKSAVILIAGANSTSKTKSITHIPNKNLKKVVKPWGHELWLNGEHPGYAFKEIFIKGPHKTSLQFHRYKKETNVLISGEARLHYNKNPDCESMDVSADDIATVALEPMAVLSVEPPVLHRIEALGDVLLYETSTPHLDDVIRVADDAQRPNGRIEEEHRVS